MRMSNVQHRDTLRPCGLLGLPGLLPLAAVPLMDPGQATGSQCAWHKAWVAIAVAQAGVTDGQEGLSLEGPPGACYSPTVDSTS